MQTDVALEVITGSLKATTQLKFFNCFYQLALNCLIASVGSRQIIVNVLVTSRAVETHRTNSVAKQRFIVSRILEIPWRSPRFNLTAIYLSIWSDPQNETIKLGRRDLVNRREIEGKEKGQTGKDKFKRFKQIYTVALSFLQFLYGVQTRHFRQSCLVPRALSRSISGGCE